MDLRAVLESETIWIEDLRDMLQQLKCDSTGSRSELIDRIMNHCRSKRSILDPLDLWKLKDLCRRFNLESWGSKEDLVRRLAES